jgi:hypothetical protein
MNNDLFMAAASLEDGSSKRWKHRERTLGGADVAHHFRSTQKIDHKLAAG